MNIILASSSPFRQAILHNLGITFTSKSPDIDESPLPQESPQALVERLARAKAQAVSADTTDFVIGSDQVATLDGDILGKPHTIDNAIAQLSRFSGREVQFFTGLCLRQGDSLHSMVEPFSVHFRELSAAEIRFYVERELPLKSAGSFKSEGLGILLFSALKGRDPNALIGLPLIALNELFAKYGCNLLTQAPYSPLK